MKNTSAILTKAKETILLESKSIANLADLLNDSFVNAVNYILYAKGTHMMCKKTRTIKVHAMAVDSLEILENNSITKKLVEDHDQNYVGVVHLHDLIKEGRF